MRAVTVMVLMSVATAAQPASGQRLLEEWRVRSTAGAEALVRGPDAVFWNPAQVRVEGGRASAALVDLRAPRMTGIDGLAAAAALALDGGRTTLGFGYEHVDVSGIEQTTTSPDGGSPIDVGENRFALAASHEVGSRLRVGALVQYTQLPDVVFEESVVAIGVGAHYQPLAQWPVYVAGMAASEGDDTYWLAGLEFVAPWHLPEWTFRADYGAAGGQLAPGVTHRLSATGEWREAVELSAGAAIEPDAESRQIGPVVAATVRLSRYRLGMVREQLGNGFGAAYSFRFSVAF